LISYSKVKHGRWHLLALACMLAFLLVPQAAQAAEGWLSPVTISGNPSIEPDLATDSTGKATAVWLLAFGGKNRVQAAVRQPGDLSFGPAQTISPSGESEDDPHVAVNDNGEAVVVWTRTLDGVIGAAYRPPGGSLFGSSTLISSTAGYAFNARIAIDQQGNAQAIWEREINGGPLVIEAATQSPQGVFGAVETVSEPTFNSDDPDIAREPNGNATAVWTRFDGTSVIQTSARKAEINYPRPGVGSPLRIPLVPEYGQCISPNTSHAPPLDSPSCDPATLESPLLTMGTAGLGGGFARFDAIAGNPSTTADEADFNIAATATDVRCTAGGTPGCAQAGGDYTGQVILTSLVRQTDLSNGVFSDDPGTTQDFGFSVPVTCTATPLSTAGSSCSITTTADSLVANYVKERKRTIIEVASVQLEDAGPDGTLTPPSGSCPPTCGSGDENVFMRQGVFAP
jgi:hypothetical protein